YRSWALAHPQRYQLLFGAPIPGYQPPNEQIMPAAARSLSALLSVIEALRQADRLHAPGFPLISPHGQAQVPACYANVHDVHDLSLAVALYVWACVHGMVSLELGANLPPFGSDGNALYDYGMASLTRQFITEIA
ncbi:MAG: WHG domain-containing protein, partial [Oscillochloris sp.]|nr:WHG domain-containing protein [Oscillochloris sp.]